MDKPIEDLLTGIKVGSSGGKPAVHKPLLVLLLLRRAKDGGSNVVRYSEISRELESLIHEFGTGVKKANAALPFLHLQSDGFWRVRDETPPGAEGKSRPSRAVTGSVGEFNGRAWEQLRKSPELIERIARRLIEKFWPEEQGNAVLTRLGLSRVA